MTLTEWMFGLYSVGLLLIGLYLGRRSKWDEQHGIMPTLPLARTFTDPLTETLEQRLEPRGLEKD